MKLRLYVWYPALTDYTHGVIFALASCVEDARDLVRQRSLTDPDAIIMPPSVEQEIQKEPAVYDSPFAMYIYGGG